MKDYSVLDNMIRMVSDTIKQAFDKGYKQGYVDGIKDGNINNGTFAQKVNDAYQNGLEDAWEAARKLRHPRHGGLEDNKQKGTFY